MLQQENGRLSEVKEVVKRDMGQVSGLKGLLGNLEAKHEQLRATVARHGDELAETRRRNSELGVRAQQLDGENRRLRDSSKGPKSQ
jgi:septal ring factor EnvC (AmiA/AmiB activator)